MALSMQVETLGEANFGEAIVSFQHGAYPQVPFPDDDGSHGTKRE